MAPKHITDNPSDVLVERYVRDLCKPDVDKHERAAIIAGYIDSKGLSQRAFGRRFGIPKSTVEDWLLYNQISPQEYAVLVAKGMKPVAIYRGLREKRRTFTVASELDVFLIDVRRRANLLRKDLVYTPRSMQLIDDAVNELNCIGVDINIKNKR